MAPPQAQAPPSSSPPAPGVPAAPLCYLSSSPVTTTGRLGSSLDLRLPAPPAARPQLPFPVAPPNRRAGLLPQSGRIHICRRATGPEAAAAAPCVVHHPRLGLTAPLVVCSLLQYSMQLVFVMFAGHLGELSLSAAPSSRPSPTSPASASCWEWEARWIHSVGNHMGQNNMICSVVDSWSFRVRFTSVPYQVSASLKYCPPTGSLFWSDIDTPQSAMLVPGSWFRPWQQRRSWHGWSRQVLKDVNTYLRLAIPSTFMTCLEYWTFEMVVLLAGFLPNPKLETSILSISLNTTWMVYTFPSGLSSAISIRVSNELGAEVPGIRKQQEF